MFPTGGMAATFAVPTDCPIMRETGQARQNLMRFTMWEDVYGGMGDGQEDLNGMAVGLLLVSSQ